MLSGDVEVDTGYIGGKAKLAKRMHNKSTVFAAIKRGGATRVEVTDDASAKSHKNFVWKNVSTNGTRLLTDAALPYTHVVQPYNHKAVNHSKGKYVEGDVHINHVESFWGHVKRSIKGTHKTVSAKWLQTYLDGFAFHANNRRSDSVRFAALLGALLQPAR
jgi:hypothetical protein